MDLKSAWEPLGLSGYDAIWRMVRDGRLRLGVGKEVRDIRSPGASRARYQVHIDRANKRLETPPEKRAS